MPQIRPIRFDENRFAARFFAPARKIASNQGEPRRTILSARLKEFPPGYRNAFYTAIYEPMYDPTYKPMRELIKNEQRGMRFVTALRHFRASEQAGRSLAAHEREIAADKPQRAFSEPPEAESAARRQVRWLPIRLIGEATGKLRGAIDERRLDELAASIRELGLLQPITVRLTVSGRFELIAGARRLRACEKLGMTHIDAIVLPAGEIDSDLLGIVENLQREPSHYIEEAETLDAILRKSGLSVQEMSGLIGISANALSAKLRLLRIPEPTRKLIRELDISERYARVLLKLTEESKQQSVARKIFENQLTLRDAESLVESILREAPATRRRVTGVVRDHRPYVNAMRDLTDQMRRTGIDAAIEVGETDTAVDVHIRMAKRGAASVTVGAD